MFEIINRQACKRKAAELLRTASVPAKAFTALYMALILLLNLIDGFAGDGIVGTFVSILTSLLASVLYAGFLMYCMAIRRGERAEYLTLFDGFSFVGKIISLEIVEYFFIFLWSLLFLIPGIVAAYRYKFARFNLYENPGIGVMEAMDMSKRQSLGYKSQLFMLDLSYLGWQILSILPTLVASTMALQAYDYSNAYYVYTAGIPDPAAYLGIPAWSWIVIQGLWGLAVSLFYYPHYSCVYLEYFENAKRTSGIGKDAGPRNNGGWNNGWGSQGPDGLGGF